MHSLLSNREHRTMAVANDLKSNAAFEIIEPMRSFAHSQHDEVGLDPLGKQTGYRPRLLPCSRTHSVLTPFPGYVRDQVPQLH